MAAEIQIGGSDSDRFFIDCDGTRRFHVLDYDTDSTGATAKEVTGWAVTFDIRRKDSDSAAIASWTCTITGTFNSVASTNTQRLIWTFLDTEVTTTLFGVNGGTYRYSLKRTDAGGETILQFGDVVIQRATQA